MRSATRVVPPSTESHEQFRRIKRRNSLSPLPNRHRFAPIYAAAAASASAGIGNRDQDMQPLNLDTVRKCVGALYALFADSISFFFLCEGLLRGEDALDIGRR